MPNLEAIGSLRRTQTLSDRRRVDIPFKYSYYLFISSLKESC